MVKDLKSEITTGYQKTSTQTFILQNFSNSDKSIRIQQNVNELQGGSTFQLCYNDECYGRADMLIINIPANSKSTDIKVVLNGGLSNYKGIAYLEFIDLKVERIIKKEISLKISDERSQDLFYSKNEIIVNSFFPNPSVKNAIMEYSISASDTDAKITLQNVLGSIVETYELSPDKNKLNISTEDLNPGVYFYTLSIKDEGLATRKLIVKK
jgi:hypothetical protein